jgi:hypothetical protein
VSGEEDELDLMIGWETTPRNCVVNLHVVTHDERRRREWKTYVAGKDAFVERILART